MAWHQALAQCAAVLSCYPDAELTPAQMKATLPTGHPLLLKSHPSPQTHTPQPLPPHQTSSTPAIASQHNTNKGSQAEHPTKAASTDRARTNEAVALVSTPAAAAVASTVSTPCPAEAVTAGHQSLTATARMVTRLRKASGSSSPPDGVQLSSDAACTAPQLRVGAQDQRAEPADRLGCSSFVNDESGSGRCDMEVAGEGCLAVEAAGQQQQQQPPLLTEECRTEVGITAEPGGTERAAVGNAAADSFGSDRLVGSLRSWQLDTRTVCTTLDCSECKVLDCSGCDVREHRVSQLVCTTAVTELQLVPVCLPCSPYQCHMFWPNFQKEKQAAGPKVGLAVFAGMQVSTFGVVR